MWVWVILAQVTGNKKDTNRSQGKRYSRGGPCAPLALEDQNGWCENKNDARLQPVGDTPLDGDSPIARWTIAPPPHSKGKLFQDHMFGSGVNFRGGKPFWASGR